MKQSSKIQRNANSDSTVSQSAKCSQMRQLAVATGFTVRELLALELIVVAEGSTLKECIFEAVNCSVSSLIEYIDDRSLAIETPEGRAAEKVLARALPMLAGIIKYKRVRARNKERSLLFAAGVLKLTPFSITFCSDSGLQQIASSWSPEKRRSMADQFSNWATQLKATADFMDGQAAVSNVN